MLTKEQFTKDIKKIMIQEGHTEKSIANLICSHQQNINAKNKSASWRYIDLVNLLDKLGYDVVWVKRHNAK